jgi:hypothetical protein
LEKDRRLRRPPELRDTNSDLPLSVHCDASLKVPRSGAEQSAPQSLAEVDDKYVTNPTSAYLVSFVDTKLSLLPWRITSTGRISSTALAIDSFSPALKFPLSRMFARLESAITSFMSE